MEYKLIPKWLRYYMNCWFDDVENAKYFGIALGSKGKLGMSIIPLCWRARSKNVLISFVRTSITVVVLCDKAQILPLPDMYGKNLIFKIGGVMVAIAKKS